MSDGSYFEKSIPFVIPIMLIPRALNSCERPAVSVLPSCISRAYSGETVVIQAYSEARRNG